MPTGVLCMHAKINNVTRIKKPTQIQMMPPQLLYSLYELQTLHCLVFTFTHPTCCCCASQSQQCVAGNKAFVEQESQLPVVLNHSREKDTEHNCECTQSFASERDTFCARANCNGIATQRTQIPSGFVPRFSILQQSNTPSPPNPAHTLHAENQQN